MQEVFEKILQKLEHNCFCGYCDFKETEKIIKQEAEEYNNDQINQLAMMYAKNLVKYGVDITKIWDTATQQEAALNQAYILGRQHERDRFEQCNNGWIQCSEPPNTSSYILLSFSNFSVPIVGRYEKNEEGGAYYIGDEDETCIHQDMFVNAWQPLPDPYQPKGEREVC